MAPSRPQKRPPSPAKKARREARAVARQEAAVAVAVAVPGPERCRQCVIPPYGRVIRCKLDAGKHEDGMHEAPITQSSAPGGVFCSISPEWEVDVLGGRLRWPQR